MDIILMYLTILFAGILHGISGSGFPIIATSIFANMYPFKEAVLLLAIPTLAVNIFSCIIGRFNPFKLGKNYWLMALACLIGSFLSVLLLIIVNPNILKVILASTIILSFIFDKKYKINLSVKNSILFGFIAGSIGGATNSVSIILMIYLLSVEDDKYKLFIAANLCFIMGKIPQLFLLGSVIGNKIYSYQIFILTLISIFSVYIGFILFKKLNYLKFKRISKIIMLMLAIVIGWQGINPLLNF